jgi:ribosomal peptide maturation radical SAM protein 1
MTEAKHHVYVPRGGNPSIPLPAAPVAGRSFCHGRSKTRQWRSPVPQSEEKLFPKCELPHTSRRLDSINFRQCYQLGGAMSGTDLPDPVRLALLRASFRLADLEYVRRSRPGSAAPQSGSNDDSLDPEAAQLAALLKSHFASLDRAELEKLRIELGHSLLVELDRKLASSGALSSEQLDPKWVPTDRSSPNATAGKPRVALVSLPWMSAALPSIQLATLSSALQREGIESEVHELYVDYAASIGLNLFNRLGNLHGFLPEWIFSRHYYRDETGQELSDEMARQSLKDWLWPEFGDVVLRALDAVTEAYLTDMLETTDWSRYDIIGCSLTISQLGASMAFARRLKLQYPQIKVIFGGSQCAGPMGRAILRICPYVDAVVHVEGELVLAELVRPCRSGLSVEGLSGVSCRSSDNGIVTGPQGELYRSQGECQPLSYDSYFQRLVRLNLVEKLNPWIPFESSRGCWYGQKNQCTFCGLHETMEFRASKPDVVLSELERLYARYGIPRFYAVDLILPREYLRSFMPEVAARGHEWIFFWEVKANMRRGELETLAAAGVRWIQPGIESLDADMLRLMKKGVSPLQNVRLLKWCEELSIYCGWNLIHGLPGEKQQSYDNMVEMIPKLHHLRPPAGSGRFQLHRFSPYFDRPEQYGIRWTGAHPTFQHAFPIAKEDLDELVYLHDFVQVNDGARADGAALERALKEWRNAYEQGASLRITVHLDGSSSIEDGREIHARGRVYELSASETELYSFVDSGVNLSAVPDAFLTAHPNSARAVDDTAGIEATVEQWVRDGLALVSENRVVALALQAEKSRAKQESFVRPLAFKVDARPPVFDGSVMNLANVHS